MDFIFRATLLPDERTEEPTFSSLPTLPRGKTFWELLPF